MVNSVNKLNWKKKLVSLVYLRKPVFMVSISSSYFRVSWFQQLPRDYKIITIIRQNFFNPINAVQGKYTHLLEIKRGCLLGPVYTEVGDPR